MKKIIVRSVVCILILILTGCNREVESEVSNSDDIVVSEEVVENAKEELYSAQEVIDLIDKLIAKYQYDDTEFIKSLVIAANYDYITEEDMNTLLSTYGYSLEELSDIYNSETGIGSLYIARRNLYEIRSGYYNSGPDGTAWFDTTWTEDGFYSFEYGTYRNYAFEDGSLNKELIYDETVDFSKRIRLYDAMMNVEDQKLAFVLYDYLRRDVNADFIHEIKPKTSGEITVISFGKLFQSGQFGDNTYQYIMKNIEYKQKSIAEDVSAGMTEVSEISNAKQYLSFDAYKEILDFASTNDKTGIVAYNFLDNSEGQTMLYDGAHFVLKKDFCLDILSPKKIAKATTLEKDVFISAIEVKGYGECWNIYMSNTYGDKRIPISITYDDGTKEEISIYITKDWR